MTTPALAAGAIVRVPKGTPIAREEDAVNTMTRTDQIALLIGAHEDRTGMLGQPGVPLIVWETRSGLARWARAADAELIDAGPHRLRSGRKRTGGNTYGRGGATVVYKPSCLCGWTGGNTDRRGADAAFAEHIQAAGRAAARTASETIS